jgi:LysR family nitrogen assimilation transcriptional regulator
MEECRRALPKIVLRLITSDSAALLSRVDDHTVDLAIVFEDQPTGAYERIGLFRQQLVLVRRRGGTRAVRSITVRELAEVPLVLPGAPNVTRAVLDRAFADAGVAPIVVAEADVFAGLLAAVQSGVAGAVIPRRDFSDERNAGALEPVPIDPPLYLHANLIHAAGAPLTRAGAAVRDLLRESILRHLGDAALAAAERIA